MSADSISSRPSFSLPLASPFRTGADGVFGRPSASPGGIGIPVIVVTGFLGAGKTTLIRALLGSPEGANSAVVVNEFGEIGIDDALLRESSDATVLLGNGCVCCRHSSELEATLRGLFVDRSRGALPSFERVLIETSGLADPGPILQSFLAERGGLQRMYGLQQVVTVIDAVNGEANLKGFVEARQQAALADMIVITKTDLAMPSQIERLQARIRDLNPAARIVPASGRNAAKAMLGGSLTNALDDRATTGHTEHSAGIGSFVLTFEAPLDWRAFSLAMQILAALRGPDLLRVKGLLTVAGTAGPVAVHYVRHLVHPPTELKAWPDGERRSRLVFITRNITKQAVADLFAATFRLQTETTEDHSDG
jgi:G3E family GTPase